MMEYASYYLFENTGNLPDQKYYWERGRKNFLGMVNTIANPDAPVALYLDTAFVNRGQDIMPQYMLAVGIEKVETQGSVQGYVRGRYLINPTDSITDDNRQDYQFFGYTRLVFTDAIHAGDALYILNNVNLAAENALLPDSRTVNVSRLDALAEAGKIHRIALDNNRYKNCVFSFPLWEPNAREMMIQSEQLDDYIMYINGVPLIGKDGVLLVLESVNGVDPTGNATVDAAEITFAGGLLTVNTPTAEQITVYSVSGARIYSAQKEAGKATFDLSRLAKGVYIVKGNAWVRKIMKD